MNGKSIAKEIARCHIVGAGEGTLSSLVRNAHDLVIAADGGYLALAQAGIACDLLIGDMDSLDIARMSVHAPVKRLPVRKDVTDLLAAVQHGMAEGYRLFHLYRVTGGRSDHTYANYQHLLYLAAHGARGVLFDGNTRVSTVTSDAPLTLPRAALGKTFSVFAASGVCEGVCLTGADYPLQNARLSPDFPLGVSNRMTSCGAKVSCTQGTLLVFFHEGDDTTNL